MHGSLGLTLCNTCDGACVQCAAALVHPSTAVQPTDYNNFNYPGRGINYSASGALCMEILPHKPKYYNPFDCTVIKQYICERPPIQPGENYGRVPALPCTGPPAAPAGAVRTVMLLNAGGPAICGFSADIAAYPGAVRKVERFSSCF
jgi:hypothetical protein